MREGVLSIARIQNIPLPIRNSSNAPGRILYRQTEDLQQCRKTRTQSHVTRQHTELPGQPRPKPEPHIHAHARARTHARGHRYHAHAIQ